MNKKQLSSTVQKMKFMSRTSETDIRQQLLLKQQQSTQSSHWIISKPEINPLDIIFITENSYLPFINNTIKNLPDTLKHMNSLDDPLETSINSVDMANTLTKSSKRKLQSSSILVNDLSDVSAARKATRFHSIQESPSLDSKGFMKPSD